MAVNKIVVNEQTIMDLTDDTVTASKLFKGITAHNKAGEQIVGTAEVWLYEEYRRLWIEKGQEPHKYNNREIVAAVMERIEAAGIWLPEQEVTKYFYRRKTHYRNRIEKELQPKPEMQDKDSQTQKEQGAGSQ